MKNLYKVKVTVYVLTSALLIGCSTNSQSASNNSRENSQSESQTPVDTTKWENINNKHFAYDYSKEDVINYFKQNGQAYLGGYRIMYGANTAYSEIDYFPETDKFVLGQYIKEISSGGGLSVVSEFIGASTVYHYRSLSEATFTGKWTGATITSQGVITSSDSSSYKYTISQIGDGFKMPDFRNVSVERTEYSSKITNEIREKVYERVKGSWNYADNVFKKINSGKKLTSEYKASDWTSLNWSGVIFNDDTVKYDNNEHSLVANNLPGGIRVTYFGNDVSSPGEHEITAKYYDPKDTLVHSQTAKLTIDDMFDVTITYKYGIDTVDTKTTRVKWGSNLLNIASDLVPDGYVLESNDSIGWNGYSDQTKTLYLKGEHENYIYVESTNPQINKKYLPVSILARYNQDGVKTTYEQYDNSTPLTFSYSDITSIKFCKSKSIDVYFPVSYGKYLYNYLTNLKKIDLSDMNELIQIPDNFMNGCSNLNEVTGLNLNSLRTIGAGFLAATNITNLNFDFSHVTSIGSRFLYNALRGDDERIITIDLPSIETIGGARSGATSLSGNYPNFIWQSQLGDNTKIILKMHNFLLTNSFIYNWGNTSDVVIEWTDAYHSTSYYYGKNWNIDIYTNHKSQQESLLDELPGSINIFSL